MIEAREFVDAARARGIDFYTGVPCSFLSPFINRVINDPGLIYVSSANEGDALATAAGAAVGGRSAVAMMQNSGLGNAVSPLTSLTWVFNIPVLLICTHRGAPGVDDEPQHELMGRITGPLFDTMDVPWEAFPAASGAIAPVLGRACEHMVQHARPYALLMAKGTVAAETLTGAGPAPRTGACERRSFVRGTGPRPARGEVLARVIAGTPADHTVVIATTGYTGRELYALEDRPNHLYLVGSMGCASSFALGLAMARPDLHVVVLDGDGAALMRMGNFATIGSYAGGNLTHLLLDNGVHDSTGGQATVAAGIDFAAIAAACGYAVACEGDDPQLVDALLATPAGSRPRFGRILTAPGTVAKLPRPALRPAQVLDRLMRRIGTRS